VAGCRVRVSEFASDEDEDEKEKERGGGRGSVAAKDLGEKLKEMKTKKEIS